MMWRTFVKEYESVDQFDEFLNQMEESGYTPVFVREVYHFGFRAGRRVTIIEALVTARKKA